jgi:hypothetical protein
MEELGDALGFESVAPPMGPFPPEDTFGMKIACVTLMKSLAPGKWEPTAQHATARRMRVSFILPGRVNVSHGLRDTEDVHCAVPCSWTLIV